LKRRCESKIKPTERGVYTEYRRGLDLPSLVEALEKIWGSDEKAMKLSMEKFFELELEEVFTFY